MGLITFSYHTKQHESCVFWRLSTSFAKLRVTPSPTPGLHFRLILGRRQLTLRSESFIRTDDRFKARILISNIINLSSESIFVDTNGVAAFCCHVRRLLINIAIPQILVHLFSCICAENIGKSSGYLSDTLQAPKTSHSYLSFGVYVFCGKQN